MKEKKRSFSAALKTFTSESEKHVIFELIYLAQNIIPPTTPSH